MAITNIQFLTLGAGKTIEESINLEILAKSWGVSSDGTDKGTNVTESGGKFHFNSKILSAIAAGAASGEAVEFDQFNTALGLKINSSLIGANNGVAGLDALGKISGAVLPALAITSTTVVADQAARLALVGSVQEGDVAVQTSDSKSYIMNGSGDGSLVGHWTELTAPGQVVSVNNLSGAVTLNTDNILEGTNKYYSSALFDADFALKDTDDLAEGTTNKYFSDAAALAAIQEEALTVSEGAGVTIRQVIRIVAGQASLAIAADSMNEGTGFRMVKDASIADAASGQFYKRGAEVPGFSALTPDAPVYLSRTVDGGITQSLAGFVTGESAVYLGRAISATVIEFNPRYEWIYG